MNIFTLAFRSHLESDRDHIHVLPQRCSLKQHSLTTASDPLKTIQFPQTSCWRLLLLFLFLKLTHDCALTTMLYHSLETEKKWVTAYCSVSQIHTEESDSSFHTTDHITKKQRRAIDSTNIYTVICFIIVSWWVFFFFLNRRRNIQCGKSCCLSM